MDRLRVAALVVVVGTTTMAHAGGSLKPTKAQPPPTAPGQPLALTGAHNGVAFKIEGASCESGAPPAATPDAEPDQRFFEACNSRLLQASAVINFPGVIFLGGAFGDKSKQFVIAPMIAVGAGGSVPVLRPSLNWWLKGGKYLFTLPDTLRFNINFIGSITGSLGGMIFPNATTTNAAGMTSTTTTSEVGYSVGLFGAFEFAWTSWDTQLQFDDSGNVTEVKGSGQMKTKIALSLGLLLGYLGNSETVGHAFVIGLQPGVTFKF